MEESLDDALCFTYIISFPLFFFFMNIYFFFGVSFLQLNAIRQTSASKFKYKANY